MPVACRAEHVGWLGNPSAARVEECVSQWAVGSCQWAVGSEQWAVFRFPFSVFQFSVFSFQFSIWLLPLVRKRHACGMSGGACGVAGNPSAARVEECVSQWAVGQWAVGSFTFHFHFFSCSPTASRNLVDLVNLCASRDWTVSLRWHYRRRRNIIYEIYKISARRARSFSFHFSVFSFHFSLSNPQTLQLLTLNS